MNFFKKNYLILPLLLLFTLSISYFSGLFDDYPDIKEKTSIQSEKPYFLKKLDYLSSFVIPSIEEDNDFDKLLESEPTAAVANLSAITSTITQEAIKSFTTPSEHPLPLLAHYNTGDIVVDEGMTPDYMISLIEEGNHILPSWKLEPYWKQPLSDDYYKNSILRAKELNLPLTFVIDPIEKTLTEDSSYFTQSPQNNPNVIDLNSNVLEKISPLGPDALWSEIGQMFANNTLLQDIQQWYPNPPLVMFVDNSTANKLNWTELENSQRYLNRYGDTTDDNFKRTVIGAQWIEKYRLLHEGIKNSFTSNSWKSNTKFIAYNPIALNIGTTPDWGNNATLTNQHFSSWPLTTDGMNTQYYTDTSTDSLNNNIFNINNLPFVLNEAYKSNSGFSNQLSITDFDLFDTSDKYRGFSQLALWLSRPNIVRGFNSESNERRVITPHFQSIIDSVELIHNDDRLQNFWKNGELVVNPTATIEQLLNVPSYYASADKWFLLDVDVNPQPEWALDTHIPVYAIALKIGVAPNREWLLFVQSFDGEQNNISVTIPEYQGVMVNASESGNFYIISENTQNSIASIDTSSNNDKYVSPYLEPVNLPTCDASNPEVQFITTNSDWSHVNDIDKSIFCVSPGDYSSIGNIQLKTSGTKNKKRYIVLNNGNDIHPGQLDRSELAKVGFTLQNTNYWVIGRMAYWESPTTLNPIKILNSDNNIINRYLMDNVGNGIYLYPGSDNNTIQNSRIQREDISIHHDRAAIGLYDNRKSNIAIKNTKIINNEIKNFVDGFQAIRIGTKNLNYEGTIIDNNHIYINKEIYTDCKGSHDRNGSCAYAENAIDLKAGSNNPNNPIIISNNSMWGFKASDKSNSFLDDPGAAIVIHNGVKNIQLINNTIFDSNVGLSIDGLMDGNYALEDANISNNIFSNIKAQVIRLGKSRNINLDHNFFQNMEKSTDNWGSKYWLVVYESSNISIESNQFYALGYRTAYIRDTQDITTFTNNVFFETEPGYISYDNSNVILTNSANLNNIDINFVTDNLTNNSIIVTD